MNAKKSTAKKLPGFKYKPRFGLIVEVNTEREQAKQYDRLKRMGFNVKVVTV